MIIHLATKIDSKAIARLHINGWRAAYRNMLPDDFLDGPIEEERLSFWSNRLESPPINQFIFLAKENENPLGFICIRLNEDKKWGTMIDNLHVHVDEKNLGVGTQLMEEAMKFLLTKESNAGVWLWAYEQNERARRFYKGFGGVEAESAMLPSAAGNSVLSIRYVWESPQQLTEGIQNKKRLSSLAFQVNSKKELENLLCVNFLNSSISSADKDKSSDQMNLPQYTQ